MLAAMARRQSIWRRKTVRRPGWRRCSGSLTCACCSITWGEKRESNVSLPAYRSAGGGPTTGWTGHTASSGSPPPHLPSAGPDVRHRGYGPPEAVEKGSAQRSAHRSFVPGVPKEEESNGRIVFGAVEFALTVTSDASASPSI